MHLNARVTNIECCDAPGGADPPQAVAGVGDRPGPEEEFEAGEISKRTACSS